MEDRQELRVRVDADTREKVEAFAAHERRSLSSAVEVLLLKALAFEKLASARPKSS